MSSASNDAAAKDSTQQRAHSSRKRKATQPLSSIPRKRLSPTQSPSPERTAQQTGVSGRAAAFSFNKVHEMFIAEQMALPDNWAILSSRGKAKKHSRSKKDIYASIAVQFSERFDSEELPVALGGTQLKNKIETMYRIFCQEKTYFTSTGNGDIADGSTLEQRMLSRCHFFFTLFNAGPQTQDDIVIRHSTSYASSRRPLTSAKACTIQRNVDDDDDGDSDFECIDGEDEGDGEDCEETGDGDGSDGCYGYATSASAEPTIKPRKPKKQLRSADLKNKDRLPPEVWAVVNVIREQSQAMKDIETRRLILEEKKQITDEKRQAVELARLNCLLGKERLEIEEKKLELEERRARLLRPANDEKTGPSIYTVINYSPRRNGSRSSSSSLTRPSLSR